MALSDMAESAERCEKRCERRNEFTLPPGPPAAEDWYLQECNTLYNNKIHWTGNLNVESPGGVSTAVGTSGALSPQS